MRKIILRILAALTLLLLLVAVLLGGLLGTESGVAWALGKAQRSAPDMLTIGRVEGHLLDRLVLGDISLNLASADIELERLIFDWSSSRLTRLELIVNELTLTGVQVRSKEVAEPPPEPLTWPVELPPLSLPLDIEISTVAISDAAFYSAPDAEPLILDAATLSTRWTETEGIVLEHLKASGRGLEMVFELALNGHLDPLADYALQLQNRISLSLDESTAFALTGTIEGSLNGEDGQLSLSQALSGAAALTLSGAVEQPLVDPRWQLLLELEELPGALMGEGLPLALSGQIETDGGFNPASGKGTANVGGHLDTASEQPELDGFRVDLQMAADLAQQQLALKQLDLTQNGQPLRFSVAGNLSADALDLDGDWESLQWPPGADPLFRSQRGDLSVTGPLTGYRIQLGADIDGQDIPPGQWQLEGNGDQETLQLEGLVGRLLEGELKVSGDIAWAPEVTWNLQAGAANIQPGELLPLDPQAVFNLELSTSGQITEAGPVAEVELQQVGGILLGHALSGGGRLSYSAEQLKIDKLALRHADNALSADGILGSQSDLSWQLQVPSLDKLLFGARGQINGEGSVNGPQTAPHIVGDITISDVSYQQFGAETLTADIDLDLADKRRSKVQVYGSALASGQEIVETVALVFDGFIRDHNLTLSAAHPQAALGLSLAGGYDMDGQLWSGTLATLEVDSGAMGPWALQQPAKLSLGPASAITDTLCLVRDASRLCADGAWQAPSGGSTDSSAEATFALDALPLAWIGQFLPEQIRSLSGELSASGEFSQHQQIQGRLKTRLTPGELVFAGASEDVAMPHSGLTLDAEAAGPGAKLVLAAGLGDSKVRLDLKLPDVLEVNEPGRALMNGELELDVPNLDMLPLIAPAAIASIDGKLDARFAIGGRVDQPDIVGLAQLVIANVDLPTAGLQLAGTRVDVNIADKAVKIDGQVTSGERIDITGSAQLDPEQGWPFELSIVGENFIATDLPNLQVLISPDLNVVKNADGLALTGQLTIPKAELLLHSLPEGARSSSTDVIVVREEAPEEITPIAMDLLVELGDEVHVAALGLNAFLAGKLKVAAKPGESPRGTGDIRINEGTFRAFSQQLEIERGLFSYTGSPLANPGINVQAVRSIDDVVVGVNALGSARRLTVSTFSTPAMPENDRISYLVTGKPASEGAKLSLNRQIGKDLSVGVSVDTHTGERTFVTRYRFNRLLHTEVGSGERSSTLDLFYSFERE